MSLFTVTVGKKPSYAEFYLEDTNDVEETLKSLTKITAPKVGTVGSHVRERGFFVVLCVCLLKGGYFLKHFVCGPRAHALVLINMCVA